MPFKTFVNSFGENIMVWSYAGEQLPKDKMANVVRLYIVGQDDMTISWPTFYTMQRNTEGYLDSSVEMLKKSIQRLHLVPMIDLSSSSKLLAINVKHMNITHFILPRSVDNIVVMFSNVHLMQVEDGNELVRLSYLHVDYSPGVFSRFIQQSYVDADIVNVSGEVIDIISLGVNITVRNLLHFFRCKINRINHVEQLFENIQPNGFELNLVSCVSPYMEATRPSVPGKLAQYFEMTGRARLEYILAANARLDLVEYTTHMCALRNSVITELCIRWQSTHEDTGTPVESYIEKAIQLSSNVLRRSIEFVI